MLVFHVEILFEDGRGRQTGQPGLPISETGVDFKHRTGFLEYESVIRLREHTTNSFVRFGHPTRTNAKNYNVKISIQW